MRKSHNKSFPLSLVSFLFLLLTAIAFTPIAQAQQTLGGITGTVTDASGGAVPDAVVTLVAEGTNLTRTQKTNQNGAYEFVDLPIGAYTLTCTHDGFQTQKVSSVTVQAYRTAMLNVSLKIGVVGSTVTVEATALIMNAVDTTNGYILEKNQIDSVPLPTGSFTGLAILAPGVNAELESGTGSNNGLGNQPIWANGQRDTSNTFMFNGVDASNLFNGKSTSSVASARVVNATGLGGAAGVSSTSAEPIQSTSAPYLAIGQALPTPPPETIEEFRVNTSMYDAQQGSTSGAHIDMSTASGTNDLHGSVYVHRGTDWLNAAPFFYKADGNIPASDKVPGLHRYTAGGTLGGPIRKNKLFGFLSYQHIHTGDQEIDQPARLRFSQFQTSQRTVSDSIRWQLHAHDQFPGKHFHDRHSLIHSESSSCESGLDGEPKGHGGTQILLPARSHHRAICLFRRSGFLATSGRWQPGGFDYQHTVDKVQPDCRRSLWLYSRENFQHYRPALYASAVQRLCAEPHRLTGVADDPERARLHIFPRFHDS